MEEAAEAAACGFIKALPGGYDTPAGDAGARLSGGERQRIAIARAMLKDSPIVVPDEATAFADPENEAFIQESISRLVKDKTLVVIAHRLSTIVRADRIVVMTGAACPPWARTRNCCKLRLCTGDSGNRIPGHGMPKERNMIETIRRLLDFSGRCRTDLLCAFGYGVLYSVSEVIPVLAIVVALEAVLSPSGGGWFAVAASGGLMGLSVAGKIIFGKRATERRMLASYDMCADKRIEVGEILKRVPLGYFSQNRLGELTATLTTTLGEIETNAVAILDKVANGFVHAVAITLLISWYDWHAGLITAAGLVVSLFVYGAMQRKGRKLSPVRQAAQSRLVAAVLEYVQGMAVVKAFGLGGPLQQGGGRGHRSLPRQQHRSGAFLLHVGRSLPAGVQGGGVGVLLSSGLLYLSGDMDLIKCLLLMVSSFMLYAHIEMMGSVSALSRVISVALDRMESLKNAPLLDERGEEFVPESFDIRMEDVVFSYDGTRLLEGINLVIPQGTTTAIVGPSGSGKTTLCSLDRPVLGRAGGQGAVRRARRAGIHLRRPAAQHQHGVSERIPV